MTGAQQELGQVLSERAVIDRKPHLVSLCDDIRLAGEDLPEGGRREMLLGLLVGLSVALLDARSVDVTQAEADEFRREWGIK